MNNNIQEEFKSRIRKRLAFAVLVIFFVLYVDIFVLKIPFFSLIFCPLLFFAFIAVLLLKRIYVKTILLQCFFGPPAVLLMLIIITPALGKLHDQWILREISKWGSELRLQKGTTGTYPFSGKKFFHGYRAVFFNSEQNDPALIFCDMFGMMRQTYSVKDDKFLEEKEI